MRTEEVFRSANDGIAEKARQLGWDFPGPFLCECSDLDCFARLELTLETYEDVRARAGWYVTAPGHEIAGAVEIRRTRGYALVQRLPGALRAG